MLWLTKTIRWWPYPKVFAKTIYVWGTYAIFENLRSRIFVVFLRGDWKHCGEKWKIGYSVNVPPADGAREKQTKYCLCGLLCFVSAWRQIRGNTNTSEGKKMFFLSMKYVLWKLLLKGIFYLFGPSSRLVCEDMCLRLDPGAGRAVEKNLLCSLYTKTH